MRLLAMSINHHCAPVEVREKLALAGDELEHALAELHHRWPSCECVLLSTCNRMELYLARPTHQPPDFDDLHRFLAQRCRMSEPTLTDASICLEEESAARHLFRVAAGLDSMVLGEPQILGQVKRAYELADRGGTVGPTLHKVFQEGLGAAKRVRSGTGIGVGRVSVASVAVDFAHQIFEDFSDKTIVGIGAGDMSKAMLRRMLELTPRRLWVVNRSLEHAAAMTESLGVTQAVGGVQPWEDLDRLLVEADIVLTGTGAAEPIITAQRFKPLLRQRRNRPLFMIDIAVPRDVDAAVGSLANVYLYNIDDLRSVIDINLDQRREQVEACEQALALAARDCLRQIHNADMGRLIRDLRRQLHGIGETEQERTRHKLASRCPHALTADDQAALSDLLDEHTRRVVNKILHLPLSRLDLRDPDAPLGVYAAALRELFKLEGEESHTPKHGN